MVRKLALLLCLGFVAACKPQEASLSSAKESLADSESIGFQVSSIGSKHGYLGGQVAYLVHLNGEPISAGTKGTFFRTAIYPAVSGQNQMDIQIFLPPKDSRAKKDNHSDYSRDYVITTFSEWKRQGTFYLDEMVTDRFDAPASNRLWRTTVPLTNTIISASQFDPLPEERESLHRECREMSQVLAQLIRRRDERGLQEISKAHWDEIKQLNVSLNAPGWVVENDAIETNTPISTLSGKCFVLVFIGTEQEVAIGKSFVAFTNAQTQSSLRLDHFLFAKQKGEWLVHGAGNYWWPINADALRRVSKEASP